MLRHGNDQKVERRAERGPLGSRSPALFDCKENVTEIMATLNRFPLLGLWAEEAARRIGYPKAEAESLGHAYAVLYAIRAQRLRQPAKEKEEKAPRRKRP